MLAIPRNRARDARFERDGWLVAEERGSFFDGRHTEVDFRTWVGLEHDLGRRLRKTNDHVCQLEIRGGALRVAQIERLSHSLLLLGAAKHAIDKVVHVAPCA